jgi:hypothetical protein
MKKLFMILVAIFASVISENLSRVAAGEGDIPLSVLAGGYASTVQGSIAVCSDPTTFLEESCTTAGALVIRSTRLSVGKIAIDSQGNVCAEYSLVNSNLPLGASPPRVFPAINIAAETLNYDPASGTGDWPFTSYTGGKCNGATFDSTGATVRGTGTVHFIASGNGKRIDGIFTADTDTVGGIGDFSLSTVNLKQSDNSRRD